jgi:hypothetical protein
MTTVTEKSTKRANGLGLKKDLKNLTPTHKVVERKIETEKKEEVKKTSSVQIPIVEETKKVEKPIVETPKVIPAPLPELSLEQKIEKVENLKILIEKREILEDSRKKLNSFVVGSPQFGENIKLTDENGNTFQTSNTEVLTKIITSIKDTLIEKIAEIETQIKF